MNNVAASIFETQTVTDETGKEYQLHSNTPLAQCEFLQELVAESKAKTTLEVGLAYGLSTLFICETLSKQGGDRHYVIDPMQKDWHNIGLKNLKDAGYGNLIDFREDYSHNVLPELHRSGVKIDFAYVDSTKVFDLLVVDAFYILRMLNIGGIMAFDDCQMLSIRRLARFLSVHPSLRVYKTHPSVFPDGWRRKMLSHLSRVVPKKEQIFAPNLIKLDSELGVGSQCVAFKKVSEDTRNWDWFEDF